MTISIIVYHHLLEEVAQHDVHLGEMGVDSAQYTSETVFYRRIVFD